METIKKVYGFAEHRARYMGPAIILLSLSAVVSIVPYYLVYQLICAFIAEAITVELSLKVGGGIALAFIAKNLCHELGLKYSHKLAYDTLMGMRKAAVAKLLRMPMGNISRYGSGELKKIFVENIEDMELILAHAIPEGVGNITGMVVTILLLFVIDWRLALAALAVLPIGILLVGLMTRSGMEKIGKYYQASKEMNDQIVQYVRGMEVIKVFTQGRLSFSRYRQAIGNYKDFTLDWYKVSWKYMSMYSVVLTASLFFVLPLGAHLYLTGGLSLSALILALMLCLGMGPFFLRLVSFIPIFPNLQQKYQRIAGLYEEPELSQGMIDEVQGQRRVTFDQVTFGYGETPVLKEVSFVAEPGTLTALVGESGAGKSTVAKLIARFWDVDQGQILLGDHKLTDYTLAALSRHISYVAQDQFLFDETILDNIRVGKPDATEAEVVAIAKKARCHDFVMALDQGYGTKVGESGDRLSGGERQRLTIARAMLMDAPIVLLDEATSCTDAENEDLIQAALGELLIDKTVIVIAHRLTTITGADQILLLEKGEITHRGTHAELLGGAPKYQQLWQTYQQARGFEYDNAEGQKDVQEVRAC